MHALHVTIDVEGPVPAGHLDQLVSEVSSRPGFVHGYWLDPIDGEGHAYVFFDTEEHARAKAPAVGDRRHGGPPIKAVSVCSVAAHA
jgi:hypothetical protein